MILGLDDLLSIVAILVPFLTPIYIIIQKHERRLDDICNVQTKLLAEHNIFYDRKMRKT